MIEPTHLVRYVIRPTLLHLAAFSGLPLQSPAAERLLLATAAQESHCGRYLRQVGGGPARGIYQIEPTTYRDMLEQTARRWPDLHNALLEHHPRAAPSFALELSLGYATAVARAYYWLDPEPLPAAGDIEGIWHYYKRRWNTILGRAEKAQFMENWERYGGWTVV